MGTEVKITPELVAEHGLKPDEYDRVLEILGREPTYTELGLFSVMWSEHCSYKSSRIHLKKFPTSGPRVIQGPGENAGIVDIGHGFAAAFKMESHNHPSYIEPYQGAATGVGGILRDVFTMGARPILCMDSLRFGAVNHPKTRHLLSGVVSGIAGYGNCIGVPTVGGETYFDESYNGNILVNVFCLGIVPKDGIFLGRAEGVGNPVIYIGSKTGRDGIHGATMASAEFEGDPSDADSASGSKRPTVQVGDPFTEKLLLEACLEMFGKDIIAGIQDMGAAGLTSSSVEMAARAGNGIEMHLDRVPRRETGMIPYELMLSESQERMLIVAKSGRENEILDTCAKWGIDAAVVGRVTDDGLVRILENGKVYAEVPATKLADTAPVYDRPAEKPAYLAETAKFDPATIAEPENYTDAFLKLVATPNLASKEWIFSQYDHMVRTNTIALPGLTDASVVRVKETGGAVAVSVDCNSRYCYLDPYTGGLLTIAESARNVVCAGGTPVGATDCLNFGNPENPGVMWQFRECVRGLADACTKLGVPIVSGNVSLYNESNGKSIYPTPTVGVVGVMDSPETAMTASFKHAGDAVILLGPADNVSISASEYLSALHGITAGLPPAIDMDIEAAVQSLTLALIHGGLISSAHDCADGGLAVAVAESCFNTKDGAVLLGAEIGLDSALSPSALLFGEGASRIIVSAPAENAEMILLMAQEKGVPAQRIGTVIPGMIRISVNGEPKINAATADAMNAWREPIGRIEAGAFHI